MEPLKLNPQLLESMFHMDTVGSITEIKKGWSMDRKFIVITGDTKYLLRVSQLSTIDRKIAESNVVSKIAKLGINTPKYYDLKSNQNFVYQLLSFVEGMDGFDFLSSRSHLEQYRLGIQAGEMLSQIHGIEVIQDDTFVKKLKEKILTRLNRYRDSKYCEEVDLLVLAYIEKNLNILDHAEVRLCHGDYHIGNMVIDGNRLGIIDFNRFDYEDKYREFVPMCFFTREISPYFCRGQIEGYFKGLIPDDFWPRLKLYLAYISLFSILWAEAYSDDDVTGMIKRKYMIYEDFDLFKLEEPKWYKEIGPFIDSKEA